MKESQQKIPKTAWPELENGTASHASVDHATAPSNDVRSKRCHRAKKIAMWAAALIISILAVAPFFYIIIENAQELRVKDGSITDQQGKLVATAEYVSYAALFDLPAFSMKTLSAVKRVNLMLSETTEAVFTITSVIKHSSCNAVTFYTPDGSDITVDGKTATVLARIHGKTHVLTFPNRRARLLKEAIIPRLYTESEFFAEEDSLSSGAKHSSQRRIRRLTSDTDNGGWAALGVSVAAAILEECSMATWQHHESVSLSSTVLVGQESIGMHVFYNTTEVRQSALRITFRDGRSRLIDYAVGVEFNFNLLGELTECDIMTAERPPELQLISRSVEGGAVLVTGKAEDGTGFVIQVDEVLLDVRSLPLQRPSLEDCSVLWKEEAISAPSNKSSHGRKLYACDESCTDQDNGAKDPYGDTCSDYRSHPNWCGGYDDDDFTSNDMCCACGGGTTVRHENMLQVAFSYGKKKGYTKNGWKVEETCEKDNAYAKIWKKGDMLAVSFDGSDDIWDWTNNLQLWKEGGYHSGFLKHVNKVKSCLDWNVSKHGGEVHYYVGHSLGGAAATIYYDLANNHARDAQVITVGAPKTHVASGCDIPGIRYADTRDPVASNVFRLMSNYNHRIENAKFYKDMTVRNWWSWNRHSDWRWVSVGCAEETNAGWLLDTAYYALKRHTSKNYLSEELKGC